MPLPLFVDRSVALKLGVAVLAVAAVLSAAGAYLLDRTTTQAVDESTLAHLEVLAGALEGSFQVFDRDKQVHPVADMVAEMGRQTAVDGLQVFDAKGVIRYSLQPQQRGTELPAAERVPAPNPRREGELVLVRGFSPRSSCLACHGNVPELGGVRLHVDRQRLQGSLFQLRLRTAATGTAIMAGVLLATLFLARRLITHPIRQLVALMGHAEDGDFLVRARVTSRDEVGSVGGAFNTMLAAITDMRAREAERSLEAASAAAEQRLAGQLDEKNKVIATQNKELQSRLRELTLLQEISKSLTTTLSLDEQLDLLSRLLADKFGYKEFTLMLLDRPAGLLRVAAAYGFPEEMGIKDMSFAVGEGIAGLVAQTTQTLLVPDTTMDSRYLHYKGRFTAQGSLLSVPMVSNGMVMGVLNLFRHQVDGFRQDEVELIQSIASQAALAIANAQLFQETVELSLTDPLTALPNRRALNSRLEVEVARAERYGEPLSVVMVDVDHFKLYNDSYGHLLGDGVLRTVAQTLCQNVRKADTVARFGGEEFCVILPRQDASHALDAAEKLRRAIRTREVEHPHQGEGYVTVSMGVATYPADGRDRDALVDAADAALYAAKRSGRNKVMAAASPPGGAPPAVPVPVTPGGAT